MSRQRGARVRIDEGHDDLDDLDDLGDIFDVGLVPWIGDD
jgi:hypothetical protein